MTKEVDQVSGLVVEGSAPEAMAASDVSNSLHLFISLLFHVIDTSSPPHDD